VSGRTKTTQFRGVAPIVLPYCEIVGQDSLRRALEIAFVCPAVGGVLATGHRGTAKSTTVRSFARMATGDLPVTLPIGATDDRVLGGWRVEALMKSSPQWQKGLLEEAGDNPGGPRMLYIDEVNLLDDHLTNIILDVASTGILVVQRDGAAKETIRVNFTLVGTMNPEEGSLRPQLLDRFGLVVLVRSAYSPHERAKVLETVLDFEEAGQDPASGYLLHGYGRDDRRRSELLAARQLLSAVKLPSAMIDLAAKIAAEFKVEGHRGELAMLRAARAAAAIEAVGGPDAISPAAAPPVVNAAHLALVTPLALVHRRAASDSGTLLDWSDEDDQQVATLAGIGYG
jgi:magnesium chelatase subunit I